MQYDRQTLLSSGYVDRLCFHFSYALLYFLSKQLD